MNFMDNQDSSEVFLSEDEADNTDNMDPRPGTIYNITAYNNSDIADLSDSVYGAPRCAKGNSVGSDSDSTSEGSCLGAMTTDGQEYYLRLGDTPRRRSALRLSRIIARQQLLRQLVQGRNSK